MLNVSNAFNEAFKSDLREVKMRIKINDITYTDEDIISFNYNSSSIVGETYAIGSTFANSIKLTLCKIVEGLKQLDVVKPEMGIVLPNGSTEFVKLGTFLISEEVNPDRNENRTSLECTDQMLMLDDNYESKLSYPAPINAVALEIANLAGVKVDKVSFGRLRQDKIEKPEGYTFRQAIGLIAQFEAGYVTFDREGLLAIKQLTDKNFEITPNEYFLKGLVKNELMFRPSGIQVKTGENEADVLSIGSKKGSVIKLENKLMGETLLKSVYEKIKGVNYYPYTLSWRGNPAIEAGDWLYITDLKGNKFKVPNLSYTLEYKGGLTAKSSVESVASNEVKFGYKSVLDQTIEYVNDALKNADGNVVSYGVDEPQNPKEGDVWFKKVGPDTQIWVYERVGDTDKFEWVLKVDTAGNTEAFEKTKDIEKDLENSKQEIIKIREQAEKGIEKANQTIKEVNDETRKELVRVQEEANQALKDGTETINNALSEQNKELLEVKTKADKALKEGAELLNSVNGLKGTVSKQGVTIDKNTNDIKVKADKVDVDTLRQTVSKQGTELGITKDAINLKADKTQVNAIDKTVKQQATDLTVQSDAIKAQVSKIEGNSTQLANLKLENDKISSTVSETENKLNNLKLGTTNLLADTRELMQKSTHSTIDESEYIKGFKVIKTIVGKHDLPFKDTYRKKTTVPLKEGQYTLSFWAKATKDLECSCYFYSPNTTTKALSSTGGYSTSPDGSVSVKISTEWTKYWVRWEQEKTNEEKEVIIGRFSDENEQLLLTQPKLELGSFPSDWSAAPEDYASKDNLNKLETSLTQTNEYIKFKADKTTVEKLEGEFKKQSTSIELNSTEIKAQASKIDNNNTQLAIVKLDNNRISNSISKTEQKIDNLAVSNLNLLTTNISDIYNSLQFVLAKGTKKLIKKDNTSIIEILLSEISGTYIFYFSKFKDLLAKPLIKEKEYSMSFKVSSDNDTFIDRISINQAEIIKYYSGEINEHEKNITVTFKPLVDSDLSQNMNFHIFTNKEKINTVINNKIYIHSFMLVNGNIPIELNSDMVTQQELSTVVQTVDSLVTAVQGKAEKSQLVQLSNQISAVVSDNKENTSSISILQGAIQSTVKKDDVISSINQSSERITLDARKIHITGDTTIANAAISSAAIRDLSADKINTGTLDARKVRVVGIDAGNITTGTLNAIHIAARSITADKLSSDAIRVGLNDFGRNMRLSPNTLEFYDSNTLTGKLTDSGQEFWYGNRFIGRVGQGSKYGDSSVRGVVNQLNYEGDYVSWSYKVNSYDSTYTSMFTLDPKGKFTGKVGIHIDKPLWATSLATDAGEIKIMKINWDGNSMPAIVSTSTRSGILFGYNQLFILHNDKIRRMDELLK